MGEVAAILKIMPENPEVDLDALRTEIEASLPDGSTIQGFDTEDVAFGLTALKATVMVSDAEGGAEPAREAFEAVGGVESVQVTDVGRV